MRNQQEEFVSRPVPGPKVLPVVGTLHAMDTEAPIQGNVRLAERHGEIFAHHLPGRAPLLMVSSRRLCDELCDESRFDKRVHQPLANIRSFAGDGLFTARTEEPNWGKAHRILMPAFSPMALQGMFDGMTDIASQLVLKWERLGPEADVDVVHDFTRLTLDTIALCSFSYRFNSFYSADMHPFVDAMVRALVESGDRGRRLPGMNKALLHKQHQYEADRELMHGIVDDLIAHRRAHPLPEGQHDILDTMLQARDPETGERLDEENVRHQLVTFLIAGHETTSGLLSFTLYELLRNPDVLQRAREHVDEVLGTRQPRYEDLAQLGYLDQVLRETLRLWPTAPAFAVHPFEATTIGDTAPGAGDGYAVDPQDTVMVLTPALHRDPEVWRQPERFDPDRFGFERAQQIPANAWKPFGNGQRSCIGRGFALQEAQLVLAMLLQRFDLALADPGYQLEVKETLTLKPEGLRVRFAVRPGRSEAELARAAVQQAGTGTGASAPAGDAESMPAVEPHGTRVQVLFGSNSGTSEAFGHRIVTRGTQLGYDMRLQPLDEGGDALEREGAVVVVTSSYEGLPPDNARKFVDWVEGLPEEALEGVRHAVLGCGNTDWARTYQRIPTLVDENLSRAGSTPVLERGVTNARGDFFGAFDEWHEQLWPAIGEALGIDVVQDLPDQRLVARRVGSSREPLVREAGLSLATVVENRELVHQDGPDAHSVRHVEIALPEGMTYRAGDYLAVLPTNPEPVVERALARFGLSPASRVRLEGASSFLPTGHELAAGELFSSWLELSLPAGRRQVEALAEACACPPEKAELLALAQEERHAEEVLARRVSVLDLLTRFASVQLELGDFLAMLTPLAPRQYSISSSPLWRPDHVTITVSVVDSPALSGQGSYRGAASTFLAHAAPGSGVSVAVRPGPKAFTPPAELATPMVMVSAGSGIAPFRGFLQERAARAEAEGIAPAPALLFHGCRREGADDLYAEELAALESRGIVEVRRAHSRDGGEVRHVQDRLWADRAEVEQLVRAGAQFFVCGDGRHMAPAVRETCVRIHQAALGCAREESEAWMDAQEREHLRYVSDVFA